MDALTATVRRFNRTVTQRIGALDDRYLARDRPLGQARVLWEIGPGGAEVATLRTRLDLDAGHLSRLLRSLEADGLVVVGPAGGDGRVREARLTAAGQAEWKVLDEQSDDLARSILLPLSDPQRGRLAAAMAEVERLAGPPIHPDPSEDVVERSVVLQALARMPEPDREALVLTVWDGLGYRDAAKVAGCSVGAFAVRLHRARRRLRGELARLDGSAGPDVRTTAREAS